MGEAVPTVGNVSITVACANEAGQIVVALRGGTLIYLSVVYGEGGGMAIVRTGQTALDREISCMDLNPFDSCGVAGTAVERDGVTAMEVDGGGGVVTGSSTGRQRAALRSRVVAVGLWDDFSVRLLSLDMGGHDPCFATQPGGRAQLLFCLVGRHSTTPAQ